MSKSALRLPLLISVCSLDAAHHTAIGSNEHLVIRATHTQEVLGEQGRRIRELTSLIQKRFKFPENSVSLYAAKVQNRGLSAVAQCESLRYKLLNGLAVRRACYGVLRFIMESGAKGCEVVVSGKLRAARAKSMKFTVRPISTTTFDGTQTANVRLGWFHDPLWPTRQRLHRLRNPPRTAPSRCPRYQSENHARLRPRRQVGSSEIATGLRHHHRAKGRANGRPTHEPGLRCEGCGCTAGCGATEAAGAARAGW